MIGLIAAGTFLIATALVAIRIAEATIGVPLWMLDVVRVFQWQTPTILSSPVWQMVSLWLLFLSQRGFLPVPSAVLIASCVPGLFLLVLMIIISTFWNVIGFFNGEFRWIVLASDFGAALISGLIFPRLRITGLFYDWARRSGPDSIWGQNEGSAF